MWSSITLLWAMRLLGPQSWHLYNMRIYVCEYLLIESIMDLLNIDKSRIMSHIGYVRPTWKQMLPARITLLDNAPILGKSLRLTSGNGQWHQFSSYQRLQCQYGEIYPAEKEQAYSQQSTVRKKRLIFRDCRRGRIAFQ